VQAKAYLSAIVAMTLMLGAGVLAVIFMTSPARLGALGVTAWFIALFGALSGSLTLVLYLIKSKAGKFDSRRTQLLYALRQGVLIGGGMTVLLALSSLRQLDLRDVILITILLALIEFYFRTRQ
jgi:hypothetical protein